MKTALRTISLTAVTLLSVATVFAQDSKQVITNYLKNNAATWGLTPDDVKDITIASTASSLSPGTKHIFIHQVYQNTPVVNGLASVAVKNNEVVHIAPRLVALSGLPVNTIALTPNDAIVKACEQLNIPYSPVAIISENKSDNQYLFGAGILAYDNVPVKLMIRAEKGQLNYVWDLSINPIGSTDWWSVQISASTGEMLFKNNWTVSCGHNHTAVNSVCKETAVTCAPPPPPGADQYKVYGLPLESPNHGNRGILINPSDVTYSPFGWHDTNGLTGDEYTITRGNNVYASEDMDDDNQPGYAPDGGPALDFNFEYDSTLGPLGNMDAVITNLFYMNNAIHDILAYYGFDEESGNFQEKNYTNQPGGSDGVNADAYDGSGTDNANFSTPPDGSNPRMQMYLWNVNSGSAHLRLHSPDSLAGNYNTAYATFGPSIEVNNPILGELVLVLDDGVDTTDACDNIQNGPELNGKIALVRRGNCNYIEKMYACQNLGALAVVFINTQNTIPGSIGGTAQAGNPVTIPACIIGKMDGDSIIESLIAGATVNAELWSSGDIDAFDSDLDNGVIAHEYGHGVSNRLVGGSGNANCMWNEEQLGEGWSDFFALILTMKSDMPAERTRGMGTYVNGEAVTGVGIRPTRYSTNFGMNAATLGYSNSMTAVHSRGYIWNTMLWEMTWDLIEEYGFDPNIKSGTGGNNMALALVVEGMKLTACNSGFVDARDGILAADELLYDGENQCLIWRAFARRGCGLSADSGSPDIADDQTEAFDVPKSCELSVSENQLSELFVYPNPGTGMITVELGNSVNPTELQVVDITGKVVLTQAINSGSTAVQLNLTELTKGAYIIRVTDEKGILVKEWLKY